MPTRPGGELASRPLHFIWIVDCSGSMAGKKVESLNFAIREAIPEMQKVADENPQAQILVRVLKFSDGAQWHISTETDIHSFSWTDLQADGVTDMGKALNMVAEALSMKNMPERGLPPVLVLLSDGQPTDDYDSGLKALMAEPWGMKAVRIAIAIGDDADCDVLQKFINHPELKPLEAKSAPELVKRIKWASTVPVKAASKPASQTKDSPQASASVPIPMPPPDTTPTKSSDVF